MKTLLSKATSIAAAVAAFLVGCALLGFGLWIVAFMAMFGLAALAATALAAPFVGAGEKSEDAFEVEIIREQSVAS